MSYKRAQQRKKRLKKLYAKTNGSIAGGAWYDRESGRYHRYYVSDYKLAGFLRKRANRAVRRAKDIPCGGGYKRVFDYWWTLF